MDLSGYSVKKSQYLKSDSFPVQTQIFMFLNQIRPDLITKMVWGQIWPLEARSALDLKKISILNLQPAKDSQIWRYTQRETIKTLTVQKDYKFTSNLQFKTLMVRSESI